MSKKCQSKEILQSGEEGIVQTVGKEIQVILFDLSVGDENKRMVKLTDWSENLCKYYENDTAP